MGKRKESQFLQVDFRVKVNGKPKRIRFSSGTTNLDDYKDIVTQAKADVINGTFDPKKYGTTSKNTCSLTFKDAAKRTFTALWVNLKSAPNISYQIDQIIRFYDGKLVGGFTNQLIEEWLAYERFDRGNTSKTIREKFWRVKHIIERSEKLWDVSRLTLEWSDLIPPKDSTQLIRNTFHYTPEIELRFRKEFLRRDNILMADFFEFLIITGLRRGEALALKWDDVDLEDRSIIVRGEEIGAGKTTNARRRVPLLAGAWEILSSHSIRGFETPFHGLTKDSVKMIFERARTKLGYESKKGITIHACRHTCATRLADSRIVDIYALQSWMGWKSIEMARIYVHTSENRLDNVRKDLDESVSKRCVQRYQTDTQNAPNSLFLKDNSGYEPSGRTFESCQAHHKREGNQEVSLLKQELTIDSPTSETKQCDQNDES